MIVNDVRMLIILQVVVIVLIGVSQAQDRCFDPFRRAGICIGIRSCPSLIEILKGPVSSRDREILRDTQCGWEGNYPKVCCADLAPVIRRPTPGFTNSLQFPTDDNTPVRRPAPTKSSILPEVGQCGVQLTNKIFGGSKAQFDEYPWLALLEYSKPDGSHGVHCGGALISDRYVITAAHCIPSYGNNKLRLINVHLGEYDIRSEPDCDPEDPRVCADPVQVIPVEKEMPHEGYSLQNLNNDIALLRLGRKAKMTYYVKPICLPTDPALQNPDITVRQQFDVAGWGRTENGYKSPIKLKVRVTGVSNEQCKQTYSRSLSPKRIVPEQLCAGGERGKDSCNGDSGGPLMGYYKDSLGRAYFYLAGIVSYGPQECGLAGWPGVYTRVSKYLPWIKSKMRP